MLQVDYAWIQSPVLCSFRLRSSVPTLNIPKRFEGSKVICASEISNQSFVLGPFYNRLFAVQMIGSNSGTPKRVVSCRIHLSLLADAFNYQILFHVPCPEHVDGGALPWSASLF